MNHPPVPTSRFFKLWPDGQWVFTFKTPTAAYEIPLTDLAGDALMFARAIAYSWWMELHETRKKDHKNYRYAWLPGKGKNLETKKAQRDEAKRIAKEWSVYQPHKETSNAH